MVGQHGGNPVVQSRFRQLSIRGTSEELGWQHGSSLALEIRKALEFYRGLFGLSEEALLDAGQKYSGIISEFNPRYAIEIEAIAVGAGLDQRLLFALNSRSEIFNNVSVAECTCVFNTKEALLAQNWDWSRLLEDLVVDLSIERPDGHRIRMLTEPGIIGKIGMNNAGLGVCLNILTTDQHLEGVPVHLLLRAILDSNSMDEVEALLREHSGGKASHILVGDSRGRCLSVEFAGQFKHRLQPEAGLLLHTNHYLANEVLNNAELFPSTRERFSKARALMLNGESRESIRAMLLDQSEAELSICRPYTLSEISGFGEVGTVFTLLMDLKRGGMEVRAGSQGDRSFYRISV
jgi:isopenicillin-N N-acyltransferase-like protein